MVRTALSSLGPWSGPANSFHLLHRQKVEPKAGAVNRFRDRPVVGAKSDASHFYCVKRSPIFYAPPTARSLSEIALAARTQQTPQTPWMLRRWCLAKGGKPKGIESDTSLKTGYYRVPVEGRREQGSRRGEKARADAGELVHQRMTEVSRTARRSRAFLHRQPLLPMFGFARAAGPDHGPKERSAVRPKERSQSAVRQIIQRKNRLFVRNLYLCAA